MATYTSYLNLEKPAVGETFNLLKINQNWDKIDQGVSALNSKVTKGIFVADERYVNSNDSTSYTVSDIHEIGFILANNGNGTEYIWVFGVRSGTELGITQLASASNYVTVTTSGLTITINCAYNTRVQIVTGKAM